MRAPVAARVKKHHLVYIAQVQAFDAGNAAGLSGDARALVRYCRTDERQTSDVDAEFLIP